MRNIMRPQIKIWGIIILHILMWSATSHSAFAQGTWIAKVSTTEAPLRDVFFVDGKTGWAVGDDSPTANGHDAVALYDKLEHAVLPLWHDNRPGWIAVMKGAISKNAAYFNSHRMMRRYATEAYLR